MTIENRKGSKKFSHNRQYTDNYEDSVVYAIVKAFNKPALVGGRVQYFEIMPLSRQHKGKPKLATRSRYSVL
jgi:hypothetical protein